jgi:DUF4097 and DUF4098 domain-containing protein YvlB
MFRFFTIVLALGSLTLPAPLRGAQPEHVTVPLSDPSRPAQLEVALLQGSITVVAGKAGEVVLTAVAREGDEEEERGEPDASHAGMRRLTNNALGFEVEEKDNRVSVSTDVWHQATDLRIEVPAASSIEVSTVNDGEVAVSGLSGELVLHNTNGDIRVADVTGPVDATTVNGDVKVVFGRTLASAAMAFSTLNGDVDLTLPADANVNVVLRSDNGDIFSDFDVQLERKPAQIESDRKKGKFHVSIARDLAGKIGAGGPELFLKTFNGDIALRKAK